MGIVPCASLVALLAAAPLLLQDPPPASQPPPPPVGTSRISGQVVAADNGAPVKRASVSIMGRSSPMSGRGAPSGVRGGVVGAQVLMTTGIVGGGQSPARTQVTDDAGRFEFPDLPAGRYSLMVMPHSGFVRTERPQAVEVGDGTVAAISIRLERTGAITGRLLDEGGEPLPRSRVSALRREAMSGGRLVPAGSGASTDDLGQFRLFDLPPGDYVVAASFQQLRPFDPGGPSEGYAPTYFPGTASLSAARQVAVKSGQDTPGIDFSLVRVAMGRITGTLRDSNGQTGGGRASVSITPRDDDNQMYFNRSGSVRPDGTFTIPDVPPGEYYLVGQIAVGDGPAAAREGAYVPVSVNGGEVTADMRTNVGATLRGRVVFEGTPPAVPPAYAARMPPEAFRVSVQARPAARGGPVATMSGGLRPATAAEDGTFEMSGLRGPIILMAAAPQLALKSVFRGGQDLTLKPMEFKGTERVSNITIVMTYDVGTLEGIVTDERGEPMPAAMVIAFHEDEARWVFGSPFLRVSGTLPVFPGSAVPPTAPVPGVPPPGARGPRVPGSFMIPGLLPGRYYVVAIEGVPGPAPSDRESLEKLRKHAVIGTVTAGAAATVQLRVVKAF